MGGVELRIGCWLGIFPAVILFRNHRSIDSVKAKAVTYNAFDVPSA